MSDEIEDQGVRWTTILMMVLATLALELALRDPGRSVSNCVATALSMLVAPTLVLAWCLRRARGSAGDAARFPRTLSRGRTALTPGAILVLFALFLLPFIGASRHFNGLVRSTMLEVALLSALRNLGLGLAVLSCWSQCAKLAALISLFLVLVAASLGEGVLLLALIGAYAVPATSWLMLVSWKRVARRAEGSAAPRLPWSAAVWVLGGTIVVFVAAAVGPPRAATALVGLVPTSGGTDMNDPEARSGVNDGDNEVSASEHPQSVGFTQSEVYLDSDRPSLYDAFNDIYGEPYRPKKSERMIPLGPTNIKEQRERPVENFQAGREFPLVRRKADGGERRPGERRAQALVYVKGQTPLHIRLVAYDQFHGNTWREGRQCDLDCPVEKEGQGAWLRLARPGPTIYRGTVAHVIKIGTLDTASLPVPGHVARFRVGSVNRPDFFGWAQDGILRMRGRTLPAGTVVDSEARIVDSRMLKRIGAAPLRSSDGHDAGAGDRDDVPPEISTLGRTWVTGVAHGWGQVEAVVDRLRQGYTHDRAAATGNCVDPISEFLLRSRRGPDYQFASAAVLILRSLGYRARVVSGLYATPERFDVRTRHTPVLREDVHFWGEVQLPGGTWVAIEPTPGYLILGPSPTLGETLASAFVPVLRWCRVHWAALAVSLAGIALSLWYRRELFDRLSTFLWRWDSGRAPGRCVLATLALVERRSHWAGRPRPPGLTLAGWYVPIASVASTDLCDDMNRLVGLADRVLYAPYPEQRDPKCPEPEVRALCRRVVRHWTLGRFRASRSLQPNHERLRTT